MNNYNGGYYNNENSNKPLSYYIKNFLLVFLFVVILIFLLLWLLPSKANINPISDQIFQSNLTNMKDQAAAYYTKDRLPEDTDESKKLTLQEMIDMKLLLGVTDKNGNTCDTSASYTEITKLEKEYKLKVNLKCGDIEDYIVTYLGCYNYCSDNSVCEKKLEDDEDSTHRSISSNITNRPGYTDKTALSYGDNYSPSSSYSNNYSYKTKAKKHKKVKKVKKAKKEKSVTKITKTIINNINNITVVIIPDGPKPLPVKHSCEIIDGTYYDKNGNVVSPSEYEKSCGAQTEHKCEIYNGKYYDKNGNVVTGDEYEASCNPKPEPEKHYCEKIDGTYYDKDGNVVSPSDYEKSCKTPEKYYCKIVDGKYYDKNGDIVNGDDYEKSCNPKPEPEKHYCEKIDGTYYDKNGNVVSPSDYKKSCEAPEKHYCEIVDGNYYDKNGNIVNGDEYEASCVEKPEKHYCEYVDGKYYDKDGNVTSKTDYEKSCGAPEKHYCEYVDGKYYDREGNIVSKEDYKKSCKSPKPIYRYQYKKQTEACFDKQYSDWSDWSDNISYDPENNSIPWGQNELTWYEKNGYSITKYYEITEDRSMPIYNVSYDKYLGSKKQYACEGYTYFMDNTTNTVYTTTTSATNWVHQKTYTTTKVPTSTLTTKYEVVGIDYDKCEETCTKTPHYKVKVYTRNIVTATDKVSSSEDSLKAVCKVKETEIPIYGKQITFAGYVTDRVLKERKTYYYHKKTREVIKDAYCKIITLYQWSYTMNDQTLINQGYRYNGKKEIINN